MTSVAAASAHDPQPGCAACGGTLAFFGTRGSYSYAKCLSCASIQLDPLPTTEQLDVAYRDDYASSNHYGSDPGEIYHNAEPFYRAVVKALTKAGVGSGRILDVGCGWGGMVSLLLRRGYSPLGIDYESASLAYCRSQALPVEIMDLALLERDAVRFDAVLLITVFEHLVDHRESLRRLAGLLKPGGVLVVLIPVVPVFGFVAALARRIARTREIPSVNGTFEPPWHTTILSVLGFEHMLRGTPFALERVTASPSGRSRGVKHLVQALATAVAVAGDLLFGRRWPLVLNRIFVCRLTNPQSRQ